MLRGGDVREIRELHRSGLSQGEIQRETGHDPKTIRKYLSEPAAPPESRARPSLLDPYKPYLEERMAQGVWNATKLLRELEERGFAGHYTIVREYLQPRRRATKETAVRRFETPPGQQGQVDWGKMGTLEDANGRRASLWGFVLTLGYSRALFCEAATDQKLGSLLRLHEEAFAFLGGVPQEILYDNMATVVNLKGLVRGRDERGEVEWNPTFRDFARYWGFAPLVCRPYRPQTKGKTESGVGYLRKSFLQGCEAADLADLRGQLRKWLVSVALERVHGTTHRVVREAWEEEKPRLQPLSDRSGYRYEPVELRRVARDAYVSYRASRYSVPWRFAGEEVRLTEALGRLEVYAGEERVATHELCRERHRVVTDPAHHRDIPLSDGPAARKPQVTIRLAPDAALPVEVRDLSVYDAFATDANENSADEGVWLSERLQELEEAR
jgi:transposase